MPSYHLTYFAARGRAEPIRLMFIYKNIPFEQELVGLKDVEKLEQLRPGNQSLHTSCTLLNF